MSIQIGSPLRVTDVMLPPERIPVVGETVIFKAALEEMGRIRLGIACICDDEGRLLGILTDGDIRRMLLTVQKPIAALLVDDALDHAIRTPQTTRPTELLAEAIEAMGRSQVWDLPVVDDHGALVGLLHLHPAVTVLLEK